MARQPSVVHAIGVSILFVSLLVAVLVYFDAHEEVRRMLEWLDAQGIWGLLLFIVLMMLVVLAEGLLFACKDYLCRNECAVN